MESLGLTCNKMHQYLVYMKKFFQEIKLVIIHIPDIYNYDSGKTILDRNGSYYFSWCVVS